MDMTNFVINEVNLIGSRCGPFEPAIQMLQQGLVDVESLIHARYPLDRGLDAVDYSPWVFPTEDAYRAKLEAHGFDVGAITLFARPTPLPGGLGDWLDTFCESFLKALPEPDRAGLKAELTEALAPRCRTADGRWTLVYVRLRVVASL